MDKLQYCITTVVCPGFFESDVTSITLPKAEILSGKNGHVCMGLNGLIFNKIDKNENIESKKKIPWSHLKVA